MVTRKKVEPDLARLDRVVADAQRARTEREQSYRGQALKLYPWICGRCAREFDHTNIHELTVKEAEITVLEREVSDLQESLATRKSVDRAKSVLQDKLGLSEPDAFRWIQKTAMDLRLSMKQVADGVVEHGVAGLGDGAGGSTTPS